MAGFFDRFATHDDPAEEPEPEESDYEQPDWTGHPHAVVPGRSNQVATLFRSEAATLVLRCIDAYPSGLEFSLRLLLAKTEKQLSASPFDFGHFGEVDRAAAVRVGVEFADGRYWSHIERRLPTPLPPEPGDIVVMTRGGGGGGRFWEWEFWLWPLPPDGPLTFHADWPARGVPETSTSIDATALRALADTAVSIGYPAAP